MLNAITVTWSFLFHILIRDLRRHREWNLLHSHGKMETTFWHSILGRKLLCQKQFLMQYFTPSICSMIAKTFFFFSFVLVCWGSTAQSTQTPERICQDPWKMDFVYTMKGVIMFPFPANILYISEEENNLLWLFQVK